MRCDCPGSASFTEAVALLFLLTLEVFAEKKASFLSPVAQNGYVPIPSFCSYQPQTPESRKVRQSPFFPVFYNKDTPWLFTCQMNFDGLIAHIPQFGKWFFRILVKSSNSCLLCLICANWPWPQKPGGSNVSTKNRSHVLFLVLLGFAMVRQNKQEEQ